MNKKVEPISITELHDALNEFIEGFHSRFLKVELHLEKVNDRLIALEELHGISHDEEKETPDV